jgi:hypothetical protein
MKSFVSWNITPCSLPEVNLLFEETASVFRVKYQATKETRIKQTASRAEVYGFPSKPEAFCGPATALLQEVTATVPLPSAYCSTGSDSRSHHWCFL